MIDQGSGQSRYRVGTLPLGSGLTPEWLTSHSSLDMPTEASYEHGDDGNL